MSIRSIVLVGVQIVALAFLFWTGPILTTNPAALILQIISVFILWWSWWVLRESKLNIFPEIRKGSSLVTAGPYTYIRHPMYLAVIVFSAVLVINSFSILRLATLAVLVIDLLFKLNYEEELLSNHFPAYKNYRKNTYRLIPFLY